ncbi:MAG: sigma factor SigF [Synechococcus sp.]|nr:sigma factor SigF [Synechococcus sp.]
MFPPFGCCPVSDGGSHSSWRHYQQRKLRMLQFWRDGIERQLAALNAAISTLEQQIVRDAGSSGS